MVSVNANKSTSYKGWWIKYQLPLKHRLPLPWYWPWISTFSEKTLFLSVHAKWWKVNRPSYHDNLVNVRLANRVMGLFAMKHHGNRALKSTFPRILTVLAFYLYHKSNSLQIMLRHSSNQEIYPSDICSYRPISNHSVFSKLLERLVLRRAMGHLNRHNILPENQSAYRQHHSTETAIASVIGSSKHRWSVRCCCLFFSIYLQVLTLSIMTFFYDD